MIEFVKNVWREVVAIQESKEAFFHGCKKLINSKCYNRLFRNLHRKGVAEIVYYSTEQDRLYLKTKDSIIVSTDNYYSIFLEIFVNQIYILPPQILEREFVVFDVGMNRGYASLYFANKENCKQVYGFELVEDTYLWAIDNFSLNPRLKQKIISFNFGLWNEDKELFFETDGIDGHSQISEDLCDNTHTLPRAVVKKSSLVFSDILKQLDTNMLRVLKIDVEGAEYTIFEDLFINNLLDEFDIVIGEYHDGIEKVKKYFSDFYCSYKENLVEDKIGMMIFINNRHNI